MTLFEFIGIAVVAFLLIKLLHWFYVTFLKGGISTKNFCGNDKWAVITGCTSGIGQGFAEEFASKKTNLVLVSRSQDKLDELSSMLESKYEIKTMTHQMDFLKVTEDDYAALVDAVQDLNITCLVNNVGINHPIPYNFLEHSRQEVDNLINCNLFSMTNMTRAIMPLILKNPKGLIINLSSYTGYIALPMMSTYSATKAFINNFSQGLQQEYKTKGISVMSLIPFYVVSKMSKFRKPSLTVCAARRLAKDTLKKIGNSVVINPYWVHDVIFIVTNRIIPLSMSFNMALSQMKWLQKKLLFKRNKNKTKAQ